MREIKFRAWSHLWKEAVGVLPVLTIDFVNRAVYVLPERELEGGNQEEWLFGEIDLMQYTGLKDKNGKEIYEGDIIKYTRVKWRCFDHPEDGEDLIHICEVYWDDKYHGFCNNMRDSGENGRIFSSGSLGFNDDRAKKNIIEVIGNIYENPELIK